MSEENKIGTYQFVAEPFHVDFNGRLTMGVLGNHLLNCAGFHASDRGNQLVHERERGKHICPKIPVEVAHQSSRNAP